MVKFLIQRPIAVIMTFVGFVVLGAITFSTLPVSLLPDIPIPEITVQIAYDNTSARELENTVVKNIRQQLLQVGHLRDIKSETRDGAATVRLKFDYGTDTDLAFIEVNEKIDASMNRLPRDVQRPRVVKASATDIPVFYLNLSLKHETPYEDTNDIDFLNLSDFANTIVKRRIEQLPEVAMADMTGVMSRYIRIVPDMNYLNTVGISLAEIESTLANNNYEPGSIVVREGYYEYNIKFSSVLRTVEDIQNIYFRKNDRLLQLKDFAEVSIEKEPEKGMSLINGKRAITLGVIKQADETMKNLKGSLEKALASLQESYPDIDFTINRNQTELLDYTIGNLKQNLSLGFLLVFIVALLFLGDAKSPIVIGMSMLSALIISFVFFYLFKQSLNIISLSGMILALGMMIDSAIIVTDIITQYREKGYSLSESCVKGTNEVITPILSSTFTTIAVFVPLVFLSGIAGAIFFDQAFAVSVGLLVSYFTGIILLPVLYHLFYGKKWEKESQFLSRTKQRADKIIFTRYDKMFHWVFNHKSSAFLFLLMTLPLCVFLFWQMPKSNMPEIDHVEIMTTIDWNENIHVEENKKRVDAILQTIDNEVTENSAYVGSQQYLLEKDNELSVSEATLYLKVANPKEIEPLKAKIQDWKQQNYPSAVVAFAYPENVFEKIFDTDEPLVVAELYRSEKQKEVSPLEIKKAEKELAETTGEVTEEVAFDEQFVITIDKQRLLRYGVEYAEVQRVLKTAFKDNHIATLRSFQQYLPIGLSGTKQSIDEVLNGTLIEARVRTDQKSNKVKIPLQSLVKVSKGEDVKTIIAGKNGEYIPFRYYDVANPEEFVKRVEENIRKNKDWEVQFSGSFFSGQKMLGELVIVLLVSVLLMYFILAAQFESFLQPLIVLLELPIDIAFALLLLWLTGNTLNLMSAIGIVVTCGIIINDSILKIDMMNELLKAGTPLMEAIHTAGERRLRAIIMTSLTTILAMVPLLFSFDMGSELQKPLAIAMIGTMLIGTLVSLYIIPLIYWLIYKNKK